MKIALLIIDVQNDYFPNEKMELKNAEKTLNKILELEQSAHENKELVIYIKHINSEKLHFSYQTQMVFRFIKILILNLAK